VGLGSCPSMEAEHDSSPDAWGVPVPLATAVEVGVTVEVDVTLEHDSSSDAGIVPFSLTTATGVDVTAITQETTTMRRRPIAILWS
jgi:hypothetical protein